MTHIGGLLSVGINPAVDIAAFEMNSEEFAWGAFARRPNRSGLLAGREIKILAFVGHPISRLKLVLGSLPVFPDRRTY